NSPSEACSSSRDSRRPAIAACQRRPSALPPARNPPPTSGRKNRKRWRSTCGSSPRPGHKDGIPGRKAVRTERTTSDSDDPVTQALHAGGWPAPPLPVEALPTTGSGRRGGPRPSEESQRGRVPKTAPDPFDFFDFPGGTLFYSLGLHSEQSTGTCLIVY